MGRTNVEEEVVGEAPETGEGVIGEEVSDMTLAANRAAAASKAVLGFREK